MQALIGDGNRITGIRGRTKAGLTVAEEGRLVVGADGRYAQAAAWVRAPTYYPPGPDLGPRGAGRHALHAVTSGTGAGMHLRTPPLHDNASDHQP